MNNRIKFLRENQISNQNHAAIIFVECINHNHYRYSQEDRALITEIANTMDSPVIRDALLVIKKLAPISSVDANVLEAVKALGHDITRL